MMKKNVFLMGWLCCIASIAGADAVQFSESGVEALTDVIIVTDEEIGNSFESTESIGIAIMENGNVIVGWEDDNNEVQEIAGAFVVYNPQGERLTPLRAYADDDGNPTPVAGGWGPKIQSNWFGAGATFGTTFYEFGYVDSLAHLQDTGDAPVIQQLIMMVPSLVPQFLHFRMTFLQVIRGISESVMLPISAMEILL